MGSEKKYGKIKVAILDVLKDGKDYESSQILEILKEKYDIDIKGNHLYTAIAQLINWGEPIIKVSKGKYKLDVKNLKEEKKLKEVEEVLSACGYMQKNLKKLLTFELSNEEFSRYKRLYILTQEYMDKLKEFGRT